MNADLVSSNLSKTKHAHTAGAAATAAAAGGGIDGGRVPHARFEPLELTLTWMGAAEARGLEPRVRERVAAVLALQRPAMGMTNAEEVEAAVALIEMNYSWLEQDAEYKEAIKARLAVVELVRDATSSASSSSSSSSSSMQALRRILRQQRPKQGPLLLRSKGRSAQKCSFDAKKGQIGG